MFSFNEYLFFFVGYLIGSIPFGVIVARLSGCDITKHGSGNTGATNVVRACGKKSGAITFILDFLKGCIPVMAYISIIDANSGALVLAVIIVIGHIFPVFNRFKGGKGVATGFGVLMAVSPFVCLATAVLWLMAFSVSRISSASALFSFAMMPFMFLVYDTGKTNLMVFAIILSLIIYLTHFNNIKRLLNGSENGFK